MNLRPTLAGRTIVAACATAAAVVTALLFGSIDVLAGHYASAPQGVHAASAPAAARAG